MNPDFSKTFIWKFIFHINYLICKFLVNYYKIFPILKEFSLKVVKIIEIVKKWSQYIFIKQKIWFGFLRSHKYRIRINFSKLNWQLIFFLITHIFQCSNKTNPFEIENFILHHILQIRIKHGWIMKTFLN